MKEYQLDAHSLLPGDRNKLRLSLHDMLQKNAPFLKAWYHNIRMARQRRQQVVNANQARLQQSQEESAIRQWMLGVPR